jgi:NAD-dependent SIR2 family protein deacetylase
MTTDYLMERAESIVACIEADISDRRGLRKELEQVDEETRAEIREQWTYYAHGDLFAYEQHLEKKRAKAGAELQRKAVALIKQCGYFLPKPAKAFFGELADFLNWQDFKKEL